jgi:quercetin dioxygenase-like cupin family protein
MMSVFSDFPRVFGWLRQDMEFKIERLVGGGQTSGRSAVFRETVAAGAGPPLHVHRDQTEIFHVIRGSFRFVVDGVETRAGVGDCLAVPEGAVHAFQNVGDEAGVLHFELLPAGKSEEFFRKLVAGEFDPERMGEFFDSHGLELAGPPLADSCDD